MDDAFLQDEGPTFERATLEIKNEDTNFGNTTSNFCAQL